MSRVPWLEHTAGAEEQQLVNRGVIEDWKTAEGVERERGAHASPSVLNASPRPNAGKDEMPCSLCGVGEHALESRCTSHRARPHGRDAAGGEHTMLHHQSCVPSIVEHDAQKPYTSTLSSRPLHQRRDWLGAAGCAIGSQRARH